jgi:hypothetical protein
MTRTFDGLRSPVNDARSMQRLEPVRQLGGDEAERLSREHAEWSADGPGTYCIDVPAEPSGAKPSSTHRRWPDGGCGEHGELVRHRAMEVSVAQPLCAHSAPVAKVAGEGHLAHSAACPRERIS